MLTARDVEHHFERDRNQQGWTNGKGTESAKTKETKKPEPLFVTMDTIDARTGRLALVESNSGRPSHFVGW
jgi:hypothetical protein